MESPEDAFRKEVIENLHKKPSKGILKNSSSFETTEPVKSPKPPTDKATKWDEMNIIATLHPPDKDYGHMKIDEPKTPYEREIPDDEHDGGVDPKLLADQMNRKKEDRLKIHAPAEDSESDTDEEETPEQRAARKAFESKRKAHYNEFYAAKMARKLLEEEEEDDDEDGEDSENISTKQRETDECSSSDQC